MVPLPLNLPRACRSISHILDENGTAIKVFYALKNSADQRLEEVSRHTGVTGSSVHWSISKLIEAGLIMKERDGNKSRYIVMPLFEIARPLLEKVIEQRDIKIPQI